MGVRVGKIVEVLESFVPLSLAEKWDNVGLQVGDGDWEVDTVLVSLNVDGEVLEEAKETGAGLVISHHPLIFETLKSVTADREPGCAIMSALGSEIAVYAAHTNADSACGGANDLLAEGLGLIKRRPLRAAEDKAEVKLVTFVPDEDVEAVRKAVCDAGGGIIGEYRDCSFRTKGKGTFFGTEDTDPAVGPEGAAPQAAPVVVPQGAAVAVPRAAAVAVPRAAAVVVPRAAPQVVPRAAPLAGRWLGGPPPSLF